VIDKFFIGLYGIVNRIIWIHYIIILFNQLNRAQCNLEYHKSLCNNLWFINTDQDTVQKKASRAKAFRRAGWELLITDELISLNNDVK